jgi:lactam utilization protein B
MKRNEVVQATKEQQNKIDGEFIDVKKDAICVYGNTE